MGTLAFDKLHGIGNDFVIVAEPVSTAEAVAICDRKFGIGADGVLIVTAAEAGGDAKLRIINADGSTAEMCGNGIRCVAKWLFDTGRVAKRSIAVETEAGTLTCGVDVDTTGKVATVTVDMGRPQKIREQLEEGIDLSGRTFPLTSISMGNPHAVTFLPGAGASESLRPLAEQYGPTLEHHPNYPKRTNAEFAHVKSPREIDLVVWERGCGITLACGTGACATAVAAVLTKRAVAGEEIQVNLPGGSLFITVAADMGGVRMRGPAAWVCRGEMARPL